MHRPRRTALTAVAIVAFALLLTSCFTANQTKVVSQINASRRAAGRSSVVANQTATSKAQRWAEHMSRTGRLEHTGGGSSMDTSGLPRWCAVAENVGKGSDTNVVHSAFMRSASHKANILGNYNRVGTGVVRRGGTVWVVHIFYRTC